MGQRAREIETFIEIGLPLLLQAQGRLPSYTTCPNLHKPSYNPTRCVHIRYNLSRLNQVRKIN